VANTRLNEVVGDFFYEDGAFSVSGETIGIEQSGVSFEANGPTYLDSHLEVVGGELTVSAVSGNHIWRARHVLGKDIEGDLALTSRKGTVDLSLLPLPNSHISLVLRDSDARITLPYGLPYSLEIDGDDTTEVVVEDLGLENIEATPSYFRGTNGTASIKVDVDIEGGGIRVIRR
jgi:hypothetical protein